MDAFVVTPNHVHGIIVPVGAATRGRLNTGVPYAIVEEPGG